MEAGRKLDKLMAERVLGQTVVTRGQEGLEDYYIEGAPFLFDRVPDYSTNLQDAMSLLFYFETQDNFIEWDISKAKDTEYKVRITSKNPDVVPYAGFRNAETLPLAICWALIDLHRIWVPRRRA